MLKSIGTTVGLFSLFAGSQLLQAAEPIKEREVELFAAIESGEVEAELIAPSARQVFLRVNNKTTEQLRIQLPKAFAGVPVLAQFQAGPRGGFPGGGFPGGGVFGGPGGQGLGLGQPGLGQGLGQNFGQGGQGGTQGVGGGFNGGAQGQFGNQLGNQFGNPIGGNQLGNGIGNGRFGIFRVPAGKIGKVSAQTFCLEHGKPDPNSKVKYRIVPIEQFVGSDERVVALCELLADRRVTQNVAQAAAWNMANGLSFEQLATMNRSESKYTGKVRMFSDEELNSALRLVERLAARVPTTAEGLSSNAP